MSAFFSRNKAAVVLVVVVALIHVFGSGSGSLARPPPPLFLCDVNLWCCSTFAI